MNNIELNKIQINNLFIDKFLELTPNDAIEIHEEELLFNSYGKISTPYKMVISFEDYDISESASASYIRELLCEHLNVNSYSVILIKEGMNEFLYQIRFAPNKEWQLVVCEHKYALGNTNDWFENYKSEKNCMLPQIGLYKRLGNSSYYFRWLDVFIDM